MPLRATATTCMPRNERLGDLGAYAAQTDEEGRSAGQLNGLRLVGRELASGPFLPGGASQP